MNTPCDTFASCYVLRPVATTAMCNTSPATMRKLMPHSSSRFDASLSRVMRPMAVHASMPRSNSPLSCGTQTRRTPHVRTQTHPTHSQAPACTTKRNPLHAQSPNLLQQNFVATALNQVWLTDTTELKSQEGVRYLATVEDLYSRRIVGWTTASHFDTALVSTALGNALQQRGIRPGATLALIHHSDQAASTPATTILPCSTAMVSRLA